MWWQFEIVSCAPFFIFIYDLTARAALPMIHLVSVWTKLQKFCPYNRVFGVPSRDEDVYL